jgi:hypothetical protein
MGAIFQAGDGSTYLEQQVQCYGTDADGNGATSFYGMLIAQGYTVNYCWISDDQGFRTPVALLDADPEKAATRPNVPDLNNVTGAQYWGAPIGSPWDNVVVGYYTYSPVYEYGGGWVFNWTNGAAQDYYHDLIPQGGGFFSGLPKIVQAAISAVAVTAGFGVGAASGANLAENVVAGNPLTQNAGLAAGADVAGLAIGAGVAELGIVDASSSGAVELGAASGDFALDASAAPEFADTGLLDPAAAVAPVESTAIDAAATTPAAVAGAAKSAIGAAGTVASLTRLVNPPKPPRSLAPPASPAIVASPACNLCGAGRALLAILPLAAIAFS